MSIEQRAHQLVQQALSRPAAQREAFVASSTGGDAELRSAVEALLCRHESATMPGDPVQAAPPTRAPEAPSAPAAAVGRHPERLGHYRVLGVLGEGGMGVVYLAEQENPRRRIALKVIRPGYLSPRLLRRFEHESQILGRLQHPGIAQIFEAGMADAGAGPQPFFAMELIEGLSLVSYADRATLDARQRLALFVRVCEAVEHAHQKGVIHRDLKPGNILVDGSGQPKILDFGVARATESDVGVATLQTDVGQLVGTVPYMSPEQIAGDPANLDTRSDVYTLGVILYELLAGKLPYAVMDKTVPEAARTITESEPLPLSRLDRGLGGDPQTIVGKALEKDKTRRYQSAAELGADIGRYLRDEPIAARPPSTLYQWHKFARRNKALVGGVAAAFVMLVGGVIGTSWQAARATAGQRLAEERRLIAEKAEAEAKAQTATAKAISGFLTGMLGSIDPEQAMGREPTVREIVERADGELAGKFADMPTVEGEVRATLGTTLHSLGRYDDAEKQWRRVLAVYEKSIPPDDERVLTARRSLGLVLADHGRFDEAEAILRSTLEAYTRLRGADDGERAVVQMELARPLQETGRAVEAEQLLRESYAVATAKLGPSDARTITILHNMASSLKAQNRMQDAADAFKDVLDRREKIFGPDHPQTLYALNSLAAVTERLGKFDEAAAMMKRAIEVRTRVMGPEHPTTITSMANLSVLLTNQKKVAEAEPLARFALEAWAKSLGENHPKTMTGMGNVAYICEELGKDEEAEAMYRRAIAARLKASAGKDPETWSPMNNLAMLLQRTGRLPEAEAQFRELMTLVDANLPADHFLGGIYRNNFGACLLEAGKLEEAGQALEKSHAAILARFGPEHVRTKRAIERLATWFERTGDTAKAAELRQSAKPPG